MNKKNLINFFEHEKLELKEKGISLQKKDVFALEDLNRKFSKEKKVEPLDLNYRKGELKSIKAKNFVGVIRARQKSFQIIPKLSQKEKESQEYSKQSIRNLLYMLTFTKKLKIKDSDLAGLNRVNDDFFETLIYLFAKNLLELIQNNVNKEYVNLEDNLTFLKGKLDFPSHIKNNSILKNRFYLHYEEFCEDNFLNQIFKFVTYILLKTTRSHNNYKILQELSFLFDEVSFKNITTEDLKKIHLNRLNNCYEPILNLAKIFLSNSSLELSSNNIETFTFIFDMNELFEEFIGELTKRIFFGSDHRVTLQGPSKHLVQSKNGQPRNLFKMMPDIEIFKYRKKAPDLIVDTKYKILKEEDAKDGVGQPDMYQMFAYSKKFKCSDIILLYPRLENMDNNESLFVLDEETKVYKKTVNLCRELWKREARESLKEELKNIFYINTPIDENVN